MDALELLSQRRSSRAAELTEPGPEGPALQRILEAAIRVPDHGKLGPWRLLVLQGTDRAWAGMRLAERFKALNPDASDALVTLEAERFLRAPVVVAVIHRPIPSEKIPAWEQQLSAGAVCQNLLLAAHASGFAGQWLTGWSAYDGPFLEALGFAPEDRLAGWIYLGTPEREPTPRVRPALEKVLLTLPEGPGDSGSR
jgi:nitroreductase